jgi:hypothetical protein
MLQREMPSDMRTASDHKIFARLRVLVNGANANRLLRWEPGDRYKIDYSHDCGIKADPRPEMVISL